jgi:hypothetical protein
MTRSMTLTSQQLSKKCAVLSCPGEHVSWLSKIGTHAASVAIFLSGTLGIQVAAMDFLEKRECILGRPSRAPVHTRCVISGGMQGGTIDVSIKTPDGKRLCS